MSLYLMKNKPKTMKCNYRILFHRILSLLVTPPIGRFCDLKTLLSWSDFSYSAQRQQRPVNRKKEPRNLKACVMFQLFYSAFVSTTLARCRESMVSLLLMEAELARTSCTFLHKVYSECKIYENTIFNAVLLRCCPA